MTQVFTGDIGTEVVLDCGTPLATAIVMQIRARGPKNSRKTFTATLEAPNSIVYSLLSGDLDQPGLWKLQAYVELPGWKGYGAVAEIIVVEPV